MILMSGRTPVIEKPRFDARTVPIDWGQEMFDQAALIRETCKWDYELRFPDQIGELLERGWAIANSIPYGPVYRSLPREVLGEDVRAEELEAALEMVPVPTACDPGALAKAAKLIARAEAR